MTDIQDVANSMVKKVPSSTLTIIMVIGAVAFFLTYTNLNAPLIKMLEATTVASTKQIESVEKLSVDIRELALAVREGNKRIETIEATMAKELAILNRRVTYVEDVVMKRNIESK